MLTSAPDEYILQFQRDWYIDALRDQILPALKAGELTDARALKMVYRRFVRNKGDNHKGVLSEGELETFFFLVKEVASQLDEQILRERGGGVPFHFKRYMDQLRDEGDPAGFIRKAYEGGDPVGGLGKSQVDGDPVGEIEKTYGDGDSAGEIEKTHGDGDPVGEIEKSQDEGDPSGEIEKLQGDETDGNSETCGKKYVGSGKPQPLIRLRSLMFHQGSLLLEGYYDPFDPVPSAEGDGRQIHAGEAAGPNKGAGQNEAAGPNRGAGQNEAAGRNRATRSNRATGSNRPAGQNDNAGDPGRRLVYVLNGERRAVEPSGLTERVRYFDRDLAVFPLFRITLTQTEVSEGMLWFTLEGEEEALELLFTSPCACLCPQMGCCYGQAGPLPVEYLPEKRQLRFSRPGAFRRWKLEMQALAGLFRQKFSVRKKCLETGLFLLYHLTRPYYGKKEIWLYFDKLYMGGDNGQYLFAHACAHLPEARHYYIIRKDAKTYGDLKREGLRPLAFGSLKNRLLALHSTAIIATHSNVRGFVGLNGFEQRFYAGRMRSAVICIQHGLTIQDIPQYQGRTVDNTCLYFCAAAREIENLSRPSYGYHPSMLKLTGLPRYDGLVSAPEPLILLAPTWRRSVVREGNRMGTAKGRNPLFHETDWYRIYLSIQTDEGLLAGLKSCGGKLQFLLHPTLSAQREDFVAQIGEHMSPWITVSTATGEGYEDVLRRASLLVTDFSGVQFDFAWMRKPILYFHPDKLPPTYGTEGFDYEKEGFGPVIRTEKDLIDAMIKMADNGFRLPEAYETRAETFFAWHDHRNCERILHELRNTLLGS